MAIIINQSSGSSALIVVVLIIVAIVGIYLWKSRSTTTTTTTTTTPAPAPTAPPAPTAEPPAEGEEETETPTETAQGEFPYTPTGSANELDDQGQGTRHYASGAPDDVTHEWEGETSANSYMIVIDITLTEIDHDDTITFKYGGTHNGSGWYGGSYSFESGQAAFGAEESHPSFSDCNEGTAIGSLVNNRVMLAAININKGEKLEVWSKKPDGAWQKDAESSNGVCGFRPNVDEDEIQIRIDAAPGIDMHSAAWYEISGTTTEGEQAGAVQTGEGSNPTLCKSRYHGKCNTECSGGNTSECSACLVACGTAGTGTGLGAGAVEIGGSGTNASRCQSEFFGRCNTECSGGSSSRCNDCISACGSANLARVFSARKRLYNNMLSAFSIDNMGKEDSDVDWDYGWNREKGRPSKQQQQQSFSAKVRSLRLGNFA